MFDTTGTKVKPTANTVLGKFRPSTPEWLKWSSLSPGWTEICLHVCIRERKQIQGRKQDSKSDHAKRTITTQLQHKNLRMAPKAGCMACFSELLPHDLWQQAMSCPEILRSSQKVSSPFLQTWHWPWACRLSVPAFLKSSPCNYLKWRDLVQKNQPSFHSIHIKHTLFLLCPVLGVVEEIKVSQTQHLPFESLLCYQEDSTPT